ncbi:MAG: Zn-dependent hydrolase, glyoxylase [Deltaproteobacteria bacterium]|nr:Zn-dependent hydrolase, glyoxylase [Deltaproteobacteria bacterium]
MGAVICETRQFAAENVFGVESMIEEVLPNLYKIEIPLPKSPLKSLNSYVIRDAERHLVIDTGWNQEECLAAMQAGLRKLGVDLRKTDFFITHLHADHFGLLSDLVTDTSMIYFNQPDANRFRAGFRFDDFAHFARLNGYPENELQASLQSHPGFKFRPKESLFFHILKEGDTIAVGDYGFRCVDTPGHTPGHMCLYEPREKAFVSGDHILNDITPNIQLWSDDRNPLEEYFASLDKVSKLDIELVLPGHRSIFRNCRERIEELKQHHQKRLAEIISILERGEKHAFQVASEMSWDILCDSWDLFPVSQKWFATGEAIAHLKYLKEKGIIKSDIRKERIVFSMNGDHAM